MAPSQGHLGQRTLNWILQQIPAAEQLAGIIPCLRVKFQTVYWHNRVIATYSTCPAVISSVQCNTYVTATVPCRSLTPMLVIFVACLSMIFASLSWFSALLLDILQRFFSTRTFLLPTVTHYDCSAPTILVPEVHQLIQKTLSSSNIFQRGQIWLVIDLASLRYIFDPNPMIQRRITIWHFEIRRFVNDGKFMILGLNLIQTRWLVPLYRQHLFSCLEVD